MTESMCETCRIAESAFKKANLSPRESFFEVYRLLSDLIRDEKLAVYAGDCYFEDMESVLNEERHFTVSFYLRCIACDSFYFFGDCIRGKPIYRKIDDISSEKIDKKLWGYRGEYFYSERNGD